MYHKTSLSPNCMAFATFCGIEVECTNLFQLPLMVFGRITKKFSINISLQTQHPQGLVKLKGTNEMPTWISFTNILIIVKSFLRFLSRLISLLVIGYKLVILSSNLFVIQFWLLQYSSNCCSNSLFYF